MDADALAREFFGYAKDVQRARRNHVPDLSHGEMPTLHFLLHHPDASPSDISRATGVSSARSANLLKGLEKKGWIRRLPDPSDGRRVLVQVTEAGAAAAHEHLDRAIAELQRVLVGLGETDAREYVRLTKRVRDLLVGE